MQRTQKNLAKMKSYKNGKRDQYDQWPENFYCYQGQATRHHKYKIVPVVVPTVHVEDDKEYCFRRLPFDFSDFLTQYI